MKQKMTLLSRTAWSNKIKPTLLLRTFALRYIPLLFVLRPRVLRLDGRECRIVIPLSWWSKNHVHSMYFAAMAAGADAAAGLLAMHWIRRRRQPVSLIFKDFNAEFFRRADGATEFVCSQGDKARDLVDEAIQSGQRQECPLIVEAFVPGYSRDEPIAKMTLTLSLKLKK